MARDMYFVFDTLEEFLMAMGVQEIFEIGLKAIEHRKVGRLRHCLEVLYNRREDKVEEPCDDPSFALLVLAHEGGSPSNGLEFERVCIDSLRRLQENSEGVVRFLVESSLSWRLLCLSCRVQNKERSNALWAEAESLFLGPAPVDSSVLPALWYWSSKAPTFLGLDLFLGLNIGHLFRNEPATGCALDELERSRRIQDFVFKRRNEFGDLQQGLDEVRKLLN